MKSLSEIETTSKRASKALGFSWGIAEEIGKGIRLLELFGLEGIKNFNQYCILKKKQNFTNSIFIKGSNFAEKYPFCPIMLGINFMDQVRSIEKFKKVTFDKISLPVLILPFLSRSSEIIGKKILIKFEQINFLLNLNVNISSNILGKDCPIIGTNVVIDVIENKDNFSEKDWKNLYKLSEKTFVEENESLKQSGAGAGLTDND